MSENEVMGPSEFFTTVSLEDRLGALKRLLERVGASSNMVADQPSGSEPPPVYFRAQAPASLRTYLGNSGHTLPMDLIFTLIPYETVEDAAVRDCGHELMDIWCLKEVTAAHEPMLTQVRGVCTTCTLGQLVARGVVVACENGEYLYRGAGVCCHMSLDEVIEGYLTEEDELVVFTGREVSSSEFFVPDGYYVVPDFSAPVVHFTPEEVEHVRTICSALRVSDEVHERTWITY